ncbi:MAG: hypothetical protein AB4911_12630 [Oscillochloridaceae bacterium umkhey_bin13]
MVSLTLLCPAHDAGRATQALAYHSPTANQRRMIVARRSSRKEVRL